MNKLEDGFFIDWIGVIWSAGIAHILDRFVLKERPVTLFEVFAIGWRHNFAPWFTLARRRG